MKKKLAIVLSAIMAIGVIGTAPSYSTPVIAEEVVQAEEIANPVYDAETDTTDYSYVYFGTYPKSELTGAALTAAITDAEYVDDVATVNGVTYVRMKQENATASARRELRGLTYSDEEFYQWENNKDYHYFKSEPIKWRVLQVEEDGNLLLMADNAIDCQRYSSNSEKYTWDDSPMRVWLNGYGTAAANGYTCGGEGFVDKAFSDEEREDIVKSTVETPGCKLWGTTLQAAKTVQDEVFLLSVEEAMNEEYGFAPDAMTLSSTRRLEPTDYAFAMGTWLGTYNDFYGSCWWMLRTSGDYLQKMALIYRTGQVFKEGYYVNTPYYGVVPALRVKADSEYLMTQAEYEEKYPEQAPVIYGDVNSDTVVNLEDASDVLRLALGIALDRPVTAEMEIAANVDGSEKVDLEDASLVLRHALGIITIFPIEGTTETAALAVSDDAIEVTHGGIITEGAINTTDEATDVTDDVSNVTDDSADATDDSVNVTDDATDVSEPVIEAPETPLDIWYAADSIAAQHINGTSLAASSITVRTRDTLGWGVIFKNYFDHAIYKRYEEGAVIETKFDNAVSDVAVTVNNTALSSRSSESFTTEKNYTTMIENIDKGDYLFISFGHNDEYPAVERYTDPYGDSSTEGSYKWYLKTKYIDPALEAGAVPVLVSSVVKRNYIDGVYQPQFHEPYAIAMEELVAEYKEAGITITFIDLHHKMDALYKNLSDEQSKLLHASYDVSEFLEGIADIDGDGIKDTGNDKFNQVLKDTYGTTGRALEDLTNDEVNALIAEVANAGFIDNETSGSYVDNVHFTHAGAQYAVKYVLEGLKENGLGLYALTNKDAVSTLKNIETPKMFKENVLYGAE